VKYDQILFIYLYLFLGSHLQAKTGRQIFVLNGSNDEGLRGDVPFWGFVDTAVHLRGQIPPNPNFLSANRHFQAIHAKNSNFHIFKTTASILHSDKDHKVPFAVVQMCPKMAAIVKNRYLRNGFMDFDEIWHGDAS